MNYRLYPVLLVLFSGFVSQALAVVSGSIDTLSGTLVTQDVIASDVNRDGIPVSVVANVSSNLAPGNDSDVLRVRFSLLDQNDVPHGPEVVVQQTISFPMFPGGLPSWNGSATFSGEIVPSTRLKPGDVFRVKAVLERDAGGGAWTQLDTETQADGGTIWHFTSTDSNDASSNTNVRLTSTALNSPYIIRNVPGQGYFRCVVGGKARRYDRFAATSPDTSNITVPLRWALRDLSDNVDVPLVATSGVAGLDLAEFAAGSPNTPVEALFNVNVDVLPQDWAAIDPLHAYELVIEAGHPGEAVFTQDSTRNTLPANWLALSGVLKFVTFTTTFDQLQFSPLPMNPSADPNAHAEGVLTIPAGHGKLPGQPNHSFGGALEVKIMLNGDAQYIGATDVNVSGPVNDTAVVNGITVKRSGITLGQLGAQAGSFEVKFPRGMSYATTAGTRRMKSKWLAMGVNLPLNADLLVQPWVLSTTNLFVAIERLPLVFAVPSITVNFQAGTFSFTPASCAYDTFAELGYLEAAYLSSQVDLPADKLLHAGNDQIFRLARANSGQTFVVSAGGDGAASIDYLRLTFDAGAYYTHFPRGLEVGAAAPGVAASQYVIQNDVVTDTSTLAGADVGALKWDPNNPPEPGKPACGSASPVADLSKSMTPDGGVLNFRPDGSLTALVNFPSDQYKWGIADNSPLTYTQTMTLGTQGRLMVPAHFLPWRGVPFSDLAEAQRTSALHLAGRSSENALTWEHPQAAEYQNGLLDYAGVNFRGDHGAGGFTGHTYIGGVATGTYDMRDESKFYIRPGGVSGTVQSDQNFNLLIYGMQMNLEGMKLAYLSNVVTDSVISGGLSVGLPNSASHASGFSITFDGLRLFADGSLDRGVLAPNQGLKTLRYWKADITPISMEFRQPDPCDASEGFLALGVETVLPALSGNQVLRGVLGFRGIDGSIIARGDFDNDFAITGIDSRLAVPGNVKVKGAGSSEFTVTPVTGAYLSAWTGPGAATGFASLAGAMDVPFFENLNIHLHADPAAPGDPEPTVHVMAPPESLGPFTLAGFDPTNSGMPSGYLPSFYRTDAQFFAHATKNWLGMISFNYPVEWKKDLRLFRTRPTPPPPPHENDPPKNGVDIDVKVASILSRVRSLTPNSADLKFNAVLGGNPLPGTSAADLIGGALNGLGASKVLDAFDVAAPDLRAALTKIASFEEAIADTPDKLVREPLTQAIAHVRTQLLVTTSQQNFRIELKNRLATQFSANSPTGEIIVPTSWKQAVFKKLDEVNDAASDIRDVIENANTVKALVNALASTSDPPGQNAGDEVPDDIQQMLNNAYGLLTYVINAIADIKSGINAIDLQIDANAWDAIIDAAMPQIATQPLSMTDAQLADAILLQFLGSTQAALLGENMRTHLSDVRDRVRTGIDEAIGGLNEMTQGGVGPLNPLLDTPGMTDFRFAKIDGSARINGDSLHELRLDADIDIKATDFKMHGHVLYKDITSDTPQGACRLSQGIAAELTLGASTTVPIGQPDPLTGKVVPSNIEAEAKFAFAANGALDGLSGRIGLTHPGTGANLGILKLKQAELGFGFGGGDGYIYGKGAARSKLYDVEAALYFGKACNLEQVLGRVDPMAAELLGDSRFNDLMGRPSIPDPSNLPIYGFYGFGYGAISLNALIGIPPSCMLNLKAGAGMGMFYFYRETGATPAYYTALGLRQDLGISGEILCVADINARISMIGAVPSSTDSLIDISSQIDNATGIIGTGKADFEATFGISPFDFTLSKTLKMDFSYKPLEFDVDF
ncbi:MAG: hypothetical protein U1F81_15215 [Verrucomicrobiaceae bacterium]